MQRTFLRFIFIFFNALLLAACGSKAPSDKDVEQAIVNLWSSYEYAFSNNFKYTSFKRDNGWREGDDYWVEVTYTVQAQYGFFDIMGDCAKATADEHKSSPLSAWGASMQAELAKLTGDTTLEAYRKYREANPEPTTISLLRAEYKPEYIDSLIIACANMYKEKNEIFMPSLKRGDQLTWQQKLRFKVTEQGWKNL